MNIISYLISAFLMFSVGNIQKWLKPYLVDNNFPDWVYDSFSFYAMLFVAAGLLNTFLIQALKPKNENDKEIITLRRRCRTADKNKKKEIKKAIENCTSSHTAEILKITKEHDEKSSRYESIIQAKDSLIHSMTGQLAEKFQIIGEYNKESSANSNAPRKSTIESRPQEYVPDIENYS